MLLSGSKFGLARRCLWWARSEVKVASHASEDAARGTDRHKVLECMINGEAFEGPALWGCEVQDWPAVEVAIREWLPADGLTEQAMYYDAEWDLGCGGDAKGRDYSPEPGEIPMTIDLLRREPLRVEVWDYKTGAQRDLEAAAGNGQLAICCLAAARSCGVTTATGILAVVADNGTARIERTEFDSLDLDAIAYEARGLMQQIPASRPQPGPWCAQKWCPARAVCPATNEALATTPLAPLTITILDAETCARVHQQIGLAEEFLETVKRARNDWLANNPAGCELADGSRLEWGIEERDSIELNPGALSVLTAADLALAIEQKTSKSAIERGIRRACVGEPRGTAGRRLAEILGALDAEHAIKTSQFGKAKVRKVKR